MLCSYCLGLVFTDSYYSNSMLPHCPALTVFCSVARCYCYILLSKHDDDDDKKKGVCKLFMEIHLTTTECHLPYGITQCYLPPDS